MKRFLAFVIVIVTMLNLFAFSASAESNQAPSVIPAIREWTGTSGSFEASSETKLVNISNSPAIEKVSGYFADILSLDLDITSTSTGTNEIVFTIDESLRETVGNEGYVLNATNSQITIKAATDIGLLYGGTTVVQSLSVDKAFPCGNAVDYPEYAIRSGMLDVGRAWVPLYYVEEITKYMAYFKLNEIHLHINDDGVNGYSGFRLESDVKGLSSEDGYYTKDEYRQYQKDMLEYGVKVVTEIDTPFHSSCYSKAENPPPFLPGNYRCLDLSKPETLEFVKNLFDEYLTGDDPVFVSKVVHIGTDEYPREYAELMRKYTDDLIKYINSKGYTPRFWGGLGKNGFQGETPMSEEAQMNFWDVGISGVQETLDSNFDVINTVNNILYTVPTTNYNFPDYFNLKRLYNDWQVNEFSLNDPDLKMEADDERLLGASFALWNDLHTAYKGVTKFDIFDRLRGMVCLISEKTWCGLDTQNMSYENFLYRYENLSLRAGGADPGRHNVKEDMLFDFESNYESIINGGSVVDGQFVLDGSSYIDLSSAIGTVGLGFPNSLEFEITLDKEATAPLFAGDGVEILANADGKGNFGFKTEFYTFTYDYKLPVGEKVKIRLSSDLKTTYLTVNDAFTYAPYNSLNANETVLTTLTVPLTEIGKGIYGKIDNIKLSPKEFDRARLLSNYNLALNAKTSVSGLEVSDGRFTSDLAVDGSESTRLSLANEKDEQWLLIDLGDSYKISGLEIAFYERVSQYEIQVSENGTDFVTVYSVSDDIERQKQTDVIKLEDAVDARYVKYVQLKRWYAPEWDTYYSGGIAEFRIFSYDSKRYSKLIDEATEYLTTLDSEDPNKKPLRSFINKLQVEIEKDEVFLTNVEYYYNEISEIVYGSSDESSEVTDEPSTEPVPEKSSKGAIIAIAAGIAVAVGAVAAILIKRKKKK